MQLWTRFILWTTALGRRYSPRGTRNSGKLWPRWPRASDAYVELETRIEDAFEEVEQLDRAMSEIALILVEKIDDPRASLARERWKLLAAALCALTTTADELLE